MVIVVLTFINNFIIHTYLEIEKKIIFEIENKAKKNAEKGKKWLVQKKKKFYIYHNFILTTLIL